MARRTEDYGLMVGDTPKEPSGVVPGSGGMVVRGGADLGFDPVFDIDQFHTKFAQAYHGPCRQLPTDLQAFRSGFLEEEFVIEYREAVESGDLAKQADALLDGIYVALGTLHLMGFNTREGWRRVHRANMGKVLANPQGDERSHRDVKYDIVKPEGWLPPDHGDLVS